MLTDRAVFPRVAASVGRVRHFVELRMTMAGCPEASIEAATLLASELATNAIVHGGGELSIELTHGVDSITIEVRDHGGGQPARREPDRDGGRGLQILDMVAEDWGVRHGPGDETVVFFRISC